MVLLNVQRIQNKTELIDSLFEKIALEMTFTYFDFVS